MAAVGRSTSWRHVVVGAVVLAGPALALAGCLGRRWEPEHFEAKQILVMPAGTDGLRIRETVDIDFGRFGRHGYERRIPNDYGEPVDVEATSPDASAAVDVAPDPERADTTRIRLGDPDETVTGQHRYVLTYTLPDTRMGQGDLSLDIIDPGETLTTDDFTVVVAGMTLEDPTCERGGFGAEGGCELVADGDVYRADLGELALDEGVSINGAVTATTEAASPEVPALPPRDEDPNPLPLAAAMLPIGAIGAAAVHSLARRRGRNDVYAGGAADAAFGGPLPPPGAPPLAVRQVPDDEMGDLATTEFEPPRGIAPWQGTVLLRERIDNDATSAWFSGHAARDVLSITKDGDDHVVLAAGSRFDQVAPQDATILREMLGSDGAIVLDGYEKRFATAWSAARRQMGAEIGASGWWKRRGPGERSQGLAIMLGCAGVVAVAVVLLIVVGLSLALGPPGGIAFAVVVPALVAFALYRALLPSRSAAGSALTLRTESFRRFLAASEGRHVEWAWQHGLVREYSAWAVALGTAAAWQRAMEQSSVPPAELSTGPLLVYSMAPNFSSAHTAPSSSGGAGGWGGGGGGVGGGGGGGSSGSW